MKSGWEEGPQLKAPWLIVLNPLQTISYQELSDIELEIWFHKCSSVLMSGIKFQMGHKRHFANESHLMASENDFSFDSYSSKILKREKVSPSSSWNGKNTSEILYFRQNNQAMLSCHYLFVYWGKKENKNNHIKNQGYPN